MTSKPRYLRATLIAPLAVVPLLLVQTLVAILAGLCSGDFSESNGHEILAMIAFYLYFLGISAAVSYMYTVLLGLPAYFILWTRGYATTGSCAVVGALLGGSFGALLLAPVLALFGALCGATVAAAFCIIAGRTAR